MKKTKIDYCDSTWNPITGCLHDCRYCYARGLANRFSGFLMGNESEWKVTENADGVRIAEIYERQYRRTNDGEDIAAAAYPFGFMPTLHKYKLDEVARWTKPRTIFVGSMADVFGAWVPDAWIRDVFDACVEAPQHRYLFLTKNPARYMQYEDAHPLMVPDRDNFWYGTSVTSNEDGDKIDHLLKWQGYNDANTYVSVEPLRGMLSDELIDKVTRAKWVIIGAETGSQKSKVVPHKGWVMMLAGEAKRRGVPVFMKESLREIMGDDFVQQLPWEVTP